MSSSRLFVTEPATARFAAGGLAEAEALLGSPLPPLPDADLEHGRPVLHVRFHPALRSQMQRFLLALLANTRVEVRGLRIPGDLAREQEEFEALLERALRSAYEADRRVGLVNLFWLAHSAELSDVLRELEPSAPKLRRAKHALHPLLCSLHRRVDQLARRNVDQACPGRIAFLGGSAEATVIDAVLEDGVALFESSAAELDLTQFLYANKRYRVGHELFTEFTNVLAGEIERRLREGDRGLQARISRHFRALGREPLATPGVLTRLAMSPELQGYLLADAWGTGARLAQAPRLRAEAEKRKPAELIDALLDLCAALRRFELVDHARHHVVVLRETHEMDDHVRRGRRVYEFGEAARVVNNAVDATVLFLDLRGFTRTSEGHVSARDLTEELYTVFDPFVTHIRRFGGTVDKFLGDGIMATYGTERSEPLGPLHALRSAILCQEELIRLRRQGRTAFKMGISVHYGRVHVARFVVDDRTSQITVIGRNVNLAGRLSSAAKKPMDEDEGVPESPGRVRDLHVTVEGGTLFNEGIAISRDGLAQLEQNLPLVHSTVAAGVMEYYDEAIGRRLLIRYAGDAKFKGVRSSFPVYEVDFVR